MTNHRKAGYFFNVFRCKDFIVEEIADKINPAGRNMPIKSAME
jgi:hypothetical protein